MGLTFQRLREREAKALEEEKRKESVEQPQKSTKKASTKKAGDK